MASKNFITPTPTPSGLMLSIFFTFPLICPASTDSSSAVKLGFNLTKSSIVLKNSVDLFPNNGASLSLFFKILLANTAGLRRPVRGS